MFSCAFVAEACFAELSANEIMARVAENQDKAIELRRYFVYQQHLTVATRHFNGKLAREEKADYQISPGANSEEKKLASITGRYRKKNAYIDFHGEPVPDESSLDGDLVKSFRDDLLNEKSKDGVGKDLFPLTSDEQKQYKFVLTGHKEVQGRDTYVIAFSPLGLGGHPKSGQWRSPQNRPMENSQDKGSYSAPEGAPASIFVCERFGDLDELMANWLHLSGGYVHAGKRTERRLRG